MYKSIPTQPPICKIETNPATANFANATENIESNLQDSNKIQNLDTNILSPSHHFLKTDSKEMQKIKNNVAVWHDLYRVSENGERITHHDLQIINMCKNETLSNSQLLAKKATHQFTICAFSLFPLESFRKNRIRFLDFVHSEDQLFSFMILTNLQNIIFIRNELYKYRMRDGSTMNFNVKTHTPPPYLATLYANFKDRQLAKDYYASFSFRLMGSSLWDFSELYKSQNGLDSKKNIESNSQNDIDSKREIYEILQKGALFTTPSRIKMLRCIDVARIDPLNARALFTRLQRIMPNKKFKKTYLSPTLNRIIYYSQKVAKMIGLKV